jgi:hypothetical protein
LMNGVAYTATMVQRSRIRMAGILSPGLQQRCFQRINVIREVARR